MSQPTSAKCWVASVLFLLVMGIVPTVSAQEAGPDSTSQSLLVTSSDWAWRPVMAIDSVRVDYIFYGANASADHGVVLKITNDRHFDVRYRFTLILRSGEAVHEEEVVGVVGARTLITGDQQGLYFAPFGPDGSVGEIGLRGYVFEPDPEG